MQYYLATPELRLLKVLRKISIFTVADIVLLLVAQATLLQRATVASLQGLSYSSGFKTH